MLFYVSYNAPPGTSQSGGFGAVAVERLGTAGPSGAPFLAHAAWRVIVLGDLAAAVGGGGGGSGGGGAGALLLREEEDKEAEKDEEGDFQEDEEDEEEEEEEEEEGAEERSGPASELLEAAAAGAFDDSEDSEEDDEKAEKEEEERARSERSKRGEGRGAVGQGGEGSGGEGDRDGQMEAEVTGIAIHAAARAEARGQDLQRQPEERGALGQEGVAPARQAGGRKAGALPSGEEDAQRTLPWPKGAATPRRHGKLSLSL